MALCGAKTRSGEPCQKHALNGSSRCKLHGGSAGKANKGNQHAVKHGIYSRVLTDEEKELWDQVELGKVDDELRICKLRLMRAIRAEQEANDAPQLDSRTEEPALAFGVPIDGDDGEPEIIEKRSYKRRDYAALIDRLMGRIESLERTRAELIKGNGGGSEDLATTLARAIDKLPG